MEKFKKITPPDKLVKEVCIDTVKKIVGIDIEKDNIDVRNGIIFISADSIIKSEIFLKKNEIIKNLTQKLSSKKIIKDIR
ncbi:MAG: hypothetical protein QGG63_01325 [Candidatus Pacebacteria bacterium]|nr:hypothetical protein [Candidatus Paceibacterota bacterium]